ncbi:hypothetical protein D3C71_1950620 [compost metagenome]
MLIAVLRPRPRLAPVTIEMVDMQAPVKWCRFDNASVWPGPGSRLPVPAIFLPIPPAKVAAFEG